MRILVTGGLGTVGSALLRQLRERGKLCLSCDLAHQPDEAGFSPSTDLGQSDYARCDVAEYRQLERLFERRGPFDLVYHCAAEFGRWNGEDFYEDLWRTNAVGTKNIIRLQERLRFRLVHFSSSEVYGDWPNVMSESVMEEHEIKQLNDYAITKWVNELQIRNSRAQFETETVVVRLFNTYGPGERYSPYRSVNCRFLYSALHGLPWTVYRGHSRSSIFLDDAVRTIANIAEDFRAGEAYNIGGTSAHTIEELSDIVLRVTGADLKLAQFMESEPFTTRHKRVDVGKAVRDLHHQQTVQLEDGMRRTAEWMRDYYRRK